MISVRLWLCRAVVPIEAAPVDRRCAEVLPDLHAHAIDVEALLRLGIKQFVALKEAYSCGSSGLIGNEVPGKTAVQARKPVFLSIRRERAHVVRNDVAGLGRTESEQLGDGERDFRA